MHARGFVVFLGAFLGCSGTEMPTKDIDNPVVLRAVTTSVGDHQAEARLYWSSNKRVTDQDNRRLIFDLETKTVTVIDKEHKVYAVRTFDEVLEQRDALNQRFEALPAAEREQLGLDKPIALTRSGRTEKIAGYDAIEYLIKGGPISGSVWVAEALQPAPAWREWERVIANVESSGYAGRQLSEEVAKLKGFAVRTAVTLNLGEQQLPLTIEVVEVTNTALPPEVLVVPEGFQNAGPAATTP
jgi:hypothetical protein